MPGTADMLPINRIALQAARRTRWREGCHPCQLCKLVFEDAYVHALQGALDRRLTLHPPAWVMEGGCERCRMTLHPLAIGGCIPLLAQEALAIPQLEDPFQLFSGALPGYTTCPSPPSDCYTAARPSSASFAFGHDKSMVIDGL